MANSPKQGRGCIFYGCLTTILVFIGVVLGIYFGIRTVVKSAVSTYTSTSPAEIPKLEISAAEQKRIGEELERRTTLALRNAQPPPIALNETELNVLLGESAEMRTLQNQIYLRPSGTQLQAHVSLPLDQFKMWQQFLGKLMAKDLSGRYFNGVAIIDPSVTNGALNLAVKDLLVNGKSLPADFTGRLKTLNLAGQAKQSPELKSLLTHLESVTVRDGQMIVQPAPVAGAARE